LNFYYTYKAFGLTVRSEFELLHWLPADKNVHASISIIQQKVDKINGTVLIENSHYTLTTEGFNFSFKGNVFHYLHAERLLCVIRDYQNEVNFFQALYGPVFSVIAYFFHRIPLHASGIVLKDKTILISGNSGSGKSSIAWLLIQKAHARFFADDVTVLSKNDNVVMAHAAFPEIKLWNDMATLYQLNKQNKIHPEVEKYFISAEHFFVHDDFKPNAIVVIQTTPHHQPKIEPISGTEKFALLYKHLYRKQLTQKVFASLDFEILTMLAKQASIYLLHRPQQVVEKEWTVFIADTFSNL